MGFVRRVYEDRLVLFLFLIPVLLFLVEAGTFEGILRKYMFSTPETILGICLFLFAFFSFRRGIDSVTVAGILFASLLTICLSLLLLYINSIYHPNYIFGLLHVHPELLFKLGIVIGCFGVVSLLFTKISRISHFLLLSTPLFVVVIASVAWITEAPWYEYFKSEDSVAEYLTAAAYFGATIYGLKALNFFRGVSVSSSVFQKLILCVLLLFSVGTFLIAAEEVSWGQRLLGYGTPEAIEEVNYQNEFNFHNVEEFTNNIYYMYIVMCVYGIFGWIVAKGINRVSPRSFLAKIAVILSPPWKYMMFFIPIALFSLTRLFDVIPEYPNYIEETLELLLGVGIFWSGYAIYMQVKRLREL